MELVRARSSQMPKVLTFAEARLTDEVLAVREEYLAAAWSKLESAYGSVGGFVEAAGVSRSDLAALRASLVG